MMLAVLGGAAALLLIVIDNAQFWLLHRFEVLVALTGIACWRWSWFMLQNARAVAYRYYIFPRLRREATEAVARHGPVPEVTVLATTYHEKPWITSRVFASVFLELSMLKSLERRAKVVVVTGCDEDDRKIRETFSSFCEETLARTTSLWPPELILLRGDKGKRLALASGMEEIARGNPRADGVVVILDGDTMFQPGLLDKVLPVFRLTPPVAGVTTNENGFVKGPAWFAEWTSLRFGLRHRSRYGGPFNHLKSSDFGIGYVKHSLLMSRQPIPGALVIAAQHLKLTPKPVVNRVPLDLGSERRIGYDRSPENRKAPSQT